MGDRRKKGSPYGEQSGSDARQRAMSLVAVSDSASRQIIRRHLYTYTVADQNTNSVFAHLAGNRRQHHMLSVVELNFEESVRLFVDDGAFCWNQIVSCQYVLLCKCRPMTADRKEHL